MKKKKLKKIPKIILFLLIILIIFIFLPRNKKNEDYKEEQDKDIKVNLVDDIFKKIDNEDISLEFLEWINKKYPKALEKLNDELLLSKYNEKMWHEVTGYSYIVLNDLYNNLYESMDNIKILESNEVSTLSFVGDISLADNWYIMPKYDERNKKVLGILSEEVLKIMNESDLMVANSEFTVSKRGSAMKGKQYTFRAKPERLSIYYEMGVDLLTLANNHVYDYGKDAFLDMLDSFDKYKLPHIGAGHNLEEAEKPYYFIINGYKIAFLNATRAEKYIMTPGATKNSEGVFRCYDSEELLKQIRKTKKESDYVITILHYGKEGYHDLEDVQIKLSKDAIDAGSDVIIGHHAHVLQGIEFYKDKPIIYNLGDFIFNGNKEDTAIFQIKLNYDGLMDYYILPALQENMYTKLLTGNEKEKLIKKIISWSVNATIDSDGKITRK